MEIEVFEQIAGAYAFQASEYTVEKYGSGLIHFTCFLKHKTDPGKNYILQQLNTQVFNQPEIIAGNYSIANAYLKKKHQAYNFLQFVNTYDRKNYYTDAKGRVWRLMNYINNSFSYDTVHEAVVAHSAAQEFAQLTYLLSGSAIHQYQSPIVDFHNLSKRYTSFLKACSEAVSERKQQAQKLIDFAENNRAIVQHYKTISENAGIPLRIIHADTKVNNILFDKTTLQALCVVDLDTLMPGYFISDLGDMIRTMLCDCPEDETDRQKINIRPDFFEAIVAGYIKGMNNSLTKEEKKNIFYAGQFMLYMQGLRFLTDYLQNDVYYPIKHKEHNLQRAQCQFWILEGLMEREGELQGIIDKQLVLLSQK